jgi:hypothetical protein
MADWAAAGWVAGTTVEPTEVGTPASSVSMVLLSCGEVDVVVSPGDEESVVREVAEPPDVSVDAGTEPVVDSEPVAVEPVALEPVALEPADDVVDPDRTVGDNEVPVGSVADGAGAASSGDAAVDVPAFPMTKAHSAIVTTASSTAAARPTDGPRRGRSHAPVVGGVRGPSGTG